MPPRPAAGGVFKAADPPELLAHAEILVLRQMSDSLTGLRGGLERVETKITDVSERVIKIEASGMLAQITTMGASLERACGRIDTLESDRDKRSGVGELINFITKTMPWIVAIAVGAMAYLGKH